MPRRTRALPDLESPFLRRLEPLSSGEPVRPPQRATALRSRRLRDDISWTSMSAVSTADADEAGKHSHHHVRPSGLWRLFQTFPNLACSMARICPRKKVQMRQNHNSHFFKHVRRDRFAFRRSQCLQTPRRGLAQLSVEAADAEPSQCSLQAD